MSSRRIPAHDADQLTGEFTRRADGFMDMPGEGGVVPVLCADDDAAMLRQGAVESHEILAVDGEDAAVRGDGEAEDGIVFNGLVGHSRFVSGEDIVAS